MLGLASAALALTGPGRYSVDAVVKHPLSREGAGIAALVASAAGAAGVLTRRKKALALRSAEPNSKSTAASFVFVQDVSQVTLR